MEVSVFVCFRRYGRRLPCVNITCICCDFIAELIELMFDCVIRRTGTIVVHGYQIMGRIYTDGSNTVKLIQPALNFL